MLAQQKLRWEAFFFWWGGGFEDVFSIVLGCFFIFVFVLFWGDILIEDFMDIFMSCLQGFSTIFFCFLGWLGFSLRIFVVFSSSKWSEQTSWSSNYYENSINEVQLIKENIQKTNISLSKKPGWKNPSAGCLIHKAQTNTSPPGCSEKTSSKRGGAD